MSDRQELVFETALDAPPEKVWRALAIPEYRDRWLQPSSDTRLELVSASANSLLTFRWLEASEESLVTFELTPQEDGGTWFRLTHAPVSIPAAANSNEAQAPTLMLAA